MKRIDTPAFKRWFGKSKVVDANGEPLVVYHGSPDAGAITSFSKDLLGMTTGSKSAQRGFFFVDRAAVASQYAGLMSDKQKKEAEKLEYLLERLDQARYSARTPEEYRIAESKYQAALERQMPLVPEAAGAGWTDIFGRDFKFRYGSGSGVIPVFLSIQKPLIIEQQFSQFRDSTYNDILKEAKRNRNDGVIIKNTDDAPFGFKLPQTIFVAFKPTQIKSAIGNRGTFDPTDPDIRNPRTIPKQFPYRYAAYLKAHFPDIWKAGGNIRGNDTFRWWSAFRKGDRSPTVMHWWNVTRPAWIARHYRDHRLPGVIAQIKWGTVGTLGVAGMKRVVEDAIRKRYA